MASRYLSLRMITASRHKKQLPFYEHGQRFEAQWRQSPVWP